VGWRHVALTRKDVPRRRNLDRDGVACAVARAIESPTYAGDNILTGAAVLLGRSGIAACEPDGR
jgi:hypothetical protein